jgi:hypothetical protein
MMVTLAALESIDRLAGRRLFALRFGAPSSFASFLIIRFYVGACG